VLCITETGGAGAGANGGCVELRDHLAILRRRWLTLVTVIVATLAGTALVIASLTPQYTASTRMLFEVRGGQSVADVADASTYLENKMLSYAQMAASPLILDHVITELHLPTTADELAKNVTATASPETVILDISVTYPNADTAAQIANAIAAQLQTSVSSPIGSPKGPTLSALTLARAAPPPSPSSPKVAQSMGLGLILALLLGLGSVALRHALDTKIRSEKDVRALTGSAVLGVVPFDPKAGASPLALSSDPSGPRSEAIRRLRTNVEFAHLTDRSNAIVITSSIPQEGKTTTAINLAVSLAADGLRVMLIDANLRRPEVARMLGLQNRVGLSTILTGQAKIEDVVLNWHGTTLDILTSGPVRPNPSDILGSNAMTSLLRQLTGTYDVVLVDSPPLLLAADAVVLSTETGHTFIVVGIDRINRSQLGAALESLKLVDVNILGLVLNKVAPREMRPYLLHTGRSHDGVLPDQGSAVALARDLPTVSNSKVEPSADKPQQVAEQDQPADPDHQNLTNPSNGPQHQPDQPSARQLFFLENPLIHVLPCPEDDELDWSWNWLEEPSSKQDADSAALPVDDETEITAEPPEVRNQAEQDQPADPDHQNLTNPSNGSQHQPDQTYEGDGSWQWPQWASAAAYERD
jgi:succinoglycan biosynthesis transport protein ExoP